MPGDSRRFKRVSRGLFLIGVVACLAAAGCSDIRPAPDDEGGGLLESPTHEQDSLHQEEERQNR